MTIVLVKSVEKFHFILEYYTDNRSMLFRGVIVNRRLNNIVLESGWVKSVCDVDRVLVGTLAKMIMLFGGAYQ